MNNRKQHSDEIFEAMSRIYRSFQHGYSPLMMKHQWGAGTFRTLLELASQDQGASVKELAEAAGITSGAMSQMVEHLHGKGLVERLEDPTDRRVVRVRMTKVAKEKLGGFKKSQNERLTKVFEDLSDAEIEKLAELISRLKLEEGGWGRLRGRHMWGKS